MRKLVTIRTISAIDPIPNADAIEVATVDGWKVVVKKGEFAVGQNVLYFEIDSILPKGNPAFEFLMARGCKLQPTEDVNIKIEGHRLRTIKLRGQVSQGLVIPIPDSWDFSNMDGGIGISDDDVYISKHIDDDFSDVFGVMKYEKPIPPTMQGVQRGNYPAWLPKTDQERVQNCFDEISSISDPWIIEEKVEGSSITIYWNETPDVTSRSVDLLLEQEGNTFVDVAKRSGLIEWLTEHGNETGQPVALRGELVGPGIQGNIYGLNDYRIYIYDIYLPKSIGGGYVDPPMRNLIMNMLLDDPRVDKGIVFRVPVVKNVGYTDKSTIDDIILSADGASQINPNTLREGVVFKTYVQPVTSFKAISNQYLLKEKE